MITYFGFVLTFILFVIFYRLRNVLFFKKIPVIVSCALAIIIILKTFNITYDTYLISAKWLIAFVAPSTLAFAYPLFENSNILIKNKRVLYSTLLIATLCALISTYVFCLFFKIDLKILLSLLPKSTTMPIALEISKNIGGCLELTACLVVITGVLGGVLGHFVLKKIKVKNDVAIGLALGSSSHIIGTAACADKGKTKQVAAGTIALILVGSMSAIIIPFLKSLIHF